MSQTINLYPGNFCLNYYSVGEDFDEVEDDADIDEIDQQEVSTVTKAQKKLHLNMTPVYF